MKLEQQRINETLALKREEYEIVRLTNTLSKSTIEDKEKEAKLEAEVFQLQAESSKKQKSLQAERASALREIATEQIASLTNELAMFTQMNRSKIQGVKELNQAVVNAEKERLTEQLAKEIEFLENKKQLGLINQQQYDLELLKLQNGYNDQIVSLDNNLKQQLEANEAEAWAAEQARRAERTQSRITAENEEQALLRSIREQYMNDVANAEMIIAQQTSFTRLESQMVLLESEYQNAIANAERIGADTTAIEEAYAQQKTAIQMQQFQAGASIAADFANNIAVLAGKNSKVGRIAAATAATISAIQGATSAFASLAPIPIVGPVLGGVAAAAALASGYANVKKIMSTKSGLPGDSGGGAPSPSGVNKPAAFSATTNPQNDINRGLASRNVITEKETNRETVLVVDDVTAAQKTETNIVELSTL